MGDFKAILFPKWKGLVAEIHRRLETKDLAASCLSRNGIGETCVICLGKAAKSLLQAVLVAKVKLTSGFVVAPSIDFSDLPLENISLFHGGHPFPNPDSFSAGKLLVEYIDNIPKGSHLIVMVSGGTSAMVASPGENVSEIEKIAVHQCLVRSGQNVSQINMVRRHLSKIKGGFLLKKLLEKDVKVKVFAVSDVPDDRPENIGSGLFAPDPTTFAQALEVAKPIRGFPVNALRYLEDGIKGSCPETLKPEEIAGKDFSFQVIAGIEHVYNTVNEIIAKELAVSNAFRLPLAIPPVEWCEKLGEALDSGKLGSDWVLGVGETDVQIASDVIPGKGGRLSHLLGTLALFLRGKKDFEVLGIATDGCDGSSEFSDYYFSSRELSDADYSAISEGLENFSSGEFFSAKGWCQTGVSGESNFGDIVLLTFRNAGENL